MATAFPVASAKPSDTYSQEVRAVAETCRHHLDAYGAWVHGYRPAPHHSVWIEKITALVEGRSDKRKLLIIAPPGHAKTSWISLVFPPWYLGNHPDHSLLLFTSSDTMAGQFSGTVKTTLEANDRHAMVFPQPACRPDRKRGWSTDGLYLKGTPPGTKDPAYRGLGYGASVIGARAHGIILDDPLTQEEARSEVEQVKAKQYHDMTVDSRLHPNGWEIAIMTRWHEADLASHLKARKEWDTLHMPAIGYWGENTDLWPERFPLEWLTSKRDEIGGPLFNCLYMGDPTAMGGTVFKSGEWFRPLPSDFDEPSKHDGFTMRQRLAIFQFWDTNFSEKGIGDYAAGLTLGLDASGQFYILGVWRGRATPTELLAAIVRQVGIYRPHVVGIEEAAFRQQAVQQLMQDVGRRLQQEGIASVPRTVRPSVDKVTRALLPASQAEAGRVFADRSAPWFQPFLAECLGFPLAANDDQVDAFSGAVQLAIEARPQRQEIRQYDYEWRAD